MKEKRNVISMIALIVILAASVRSGLAQEAGPEPKTQEPASVEAVVADLIPIQGRLTDASGAPLPNGDYAITFRLYDQEMVGAGIRFCEDTETVTVTSGLFSALMGNCTAEDINGRELWLSVEVENDGEMTPRQRIAPVPYAWSLRPGASILGEVAGDSVLEAHNSSTSNGSRGLYGRAYGLTGTTYGVYGESYSGDGYGGYFVSTTLTGSGVGLYARGAGNDSPDLVLGANSLANDDGRISSDPANASSDLLLVSNGAVDVHLDENMDEGGGIFRILNGADDAVISAYGDGTVYLWGDVRQNRESDGLVKAAVYAICSDSGSAITRSFNNVSGAITIADGTAEGRCTLDFGFVVNDRYFVATAFTSGIGAAARGISCDWGADSEKLECFRWNAAGDGANGKIMVLVY